MQESAAHKKLARILRTNEDIIRDLKSRMEKITGLKGVLEEITEMNEWNITKTLRRFNLSEKAVDAADVQEALIDHISKSEDLLIKRFDNHKEKNEVAFNNFAALINEGLSLIRSPRLWVLKKEKAKEILINNPPPNILKHFNYKNGEELLEKEKVEEIFSALRFMESNEWMHKTFDLGYSKLTPDDFEERNVEVILLDKKWLGVGREFIEKKKHNLSHLKELGIIFIIPIPIDQAGELMRITALLFHYLIEVEFYSSLFRSAVNDGNFAKKIISFLRGDVLEKPLKADGGMRWLIVQRYLSKDNPNDPRLFIPHINPEAIHWRKAEEALAQLDKSDLSLTLSFWKDLDWVGDYFLDKKNNEERLVSFDLIDATMSLVKKEQGEHFLYHQQEALWNKIFIEFLSEEKLENLVFSNLIKGYIDL